MYILSHKLLLNMNFINFVCSDIHSELNSNLRRKYQ